MSYTPEVPTTSGLAAVILNFGHVHAVRDLHRGFIVLDILKNIGVEVGITLLCHTRRKLQSFMASRAPF
jgi:hypothetical protein